MSPVLPEAQRMKQRTAPSWAAPALTALMVVTMLVSAERAFLPVIGISGSAALILATVAELVFILTHGYIALGWRNIVAFAAITVLVSFAAEAIGVATGLIFGPYHYTDLLGAKLLGVPLMIQAAYLAMGYASMVTGRIILSMLRPLKGWAILAASLAGTFIMVSWDVAMDPYQSTVWGSWLWHTGGPYFGVPMHNYAGWFGTVFAFMILYFSFAHRYEEQPRADLIRNRAAFWSLPVLSYALTAIDIVIIPLIGGVTTPYASPTNYNGTPQTLGASISLVTIFAMGSPVVFALCRLLTAR